MTTANTRTRTNATVNTNTETGINVVAKGTFAVAGVASAIIGLWAVACFVGAMVNSGGPIGLVKAWFSAVGM